MSTRDTPPSLAQIEAMEPGPARIKAFNAWLARMEEAKRRVLNLRNSDVLNVYTAEGWDNHARVAALTGMKPGTVRAIRGPASNTPTTKGRS